ncbi:MAG: hypothetical protein PQJ50_17185 [Spirochaetales bacterium]|nr:hypothetical protein [Spirochaetales bacterium]
MKIYRMIPHTGTKYLYIENTGFSWEIIDSIVDGEKVDIVDDSKLVIKNKSKILPDYIGTGSSEVFISEQLKNFLNEKDLKQIINYVPIVLFKKNYYLLNIIGLRDCMDYSKSEYTTYPKNDLPDKITSLVFDETKINSIDIFRMKDKSLHIFVTEKLKRELENKKFTGIKFYESMDLTYG